MKKDTIAAISTGMTNSGIGIVRLSGNEALEIADKVYRGKEKITEVPSHTIHYGHIADGEETVDEVLMMVMHGPRTFTGEDTVEINCHGGTYVVSRVLETVLYVFQVFRSKNRGRSNIFLILSFVYCIAKRRVKMNLHFHTPLFFSDPT